MRLTQEPKHERVSYLSLREMMTVVLARRIADIVKSGLHTSGVI